MPRQGDMEDNIGPLPLSYGLHEADTSERRLKGANFASLLFGLIGFATTGLAVADEVFWGNWLLSSLLTPIAFLFGLLCGATSAFALHAALRLGPRRSRTVGVIFLLFLIAIGLAVLALLASSNSERAYLGEY